MSLQELGVCKYPLAGNSCFLAELMKMGLPTTQTTKQTHMVSKHLSDHLISTTDKASRFKHTNHNQIKKRINGAKSITNLQITYI